MTENCLVWRGTLTQVAVPLYQSVVPPPSTVLGFASALFMDPTLSFLIPSNVWPANKSIGLCP